MHAQLSLLYAKGMLHEGVAETTVQHGMCFVLLVLVGAMLWAVADWTACLVSSNFEYEHGQVSLARRTSLGSYPVAVLPLPCA